MKNSWLDKLLPDRTRKKHSWLRGVISGSLYKTSDLRGNSSFADITTQIDTMRALARDSQINTALSYYATDSTTANSSGQIIWATPIDEKSKEVAEIINTLFKKWKVVEYARDHILELATVGNLYIPTTDMYKPSVQGSRTHVNVALDFNSIPDNEFDIIPSTKIDPKEIVHLWYQGCPEGFVHKPDEDGSGYIRYPETAVIHFSLGGLLGDYTLDAKTEDGEKIYDIQFAQPLFEAAVQPTQTLSLLEDANILSSLIRIVKFINVDCSDTEDEDEIQDSLQQIKDAIEQQLSLNTTSGDVQSFVNPQSPNNMIYLPKINGQEAISITDLNMAEHNETDNKLLEYYQNKKLSVLGVPKEMLNFSSNEGLGGAGNVMSQRSAIYANGLQRLMSAYMSGWTTALNTYFTSRNMSGFCDRFILHMNPIITPLSTVQAEKRDAALSQASTLVQLLKDMGVKDESPYLTAITEILCEAFPKMSADATGWKVDLLEDNEGGGGDDF